MKTIHNIKEERLLEMIRIAKRDFTNDNIVIPIPDFISKKFTTYCSMREDLLMMKQYCMRLYDEKDKTIQSALTYSIISLYGKCFTDATTSKSPKLEEKEIFKDSGKFLNTHKEIIELRHQFIAHRGETPSEVTAAFLLVPKETNDYTNIRYKRLKQISFSNSMLKEIIELIAFLIKDLEKKIDKAAEKVKKGMLENLTPEQLASMNINNMKE